MSLRGLLASPLGFLVGLSLGALGSGGSILAVPLLVYLAGQSPREATASSLVLVGLAAAVGLAPHWRAGRVAITTGLLFGAAGIPGSIAGTVVNRRLDPDLLLLVFAALVLLAAWRMATGCPTCTRVGEAEVERVEPAEPHGPGVLSTTVTTRSTAAVLAAGTAVGFLTGLLGVGGGFVIVPALTLLLYLPMPVAIGTSLLVITVNSSVALAARAATTTIDWSVAAPFAVAAVAGALAGGRVAGRLDPERSLRWFAWLLVAVALWTAGGVVVGL